MKSLKMSLVAILAIIFGIAGSAFTIKKASVDGPYFYKYSGTSTGGLMTEANWNQVSSVPAGGCNSSGVNCVIQLDVAPDENLHPDFIEAGISDTGDIDAVTQSRKLP